IRSRAWMEDRTVSKHIGQSLQGRIATLQQAGLSALKQATTRKPQLRPSLPATAIARSKRPAILADVIGQWFSRWHREDDPSGKKTWQSAGMPLGSACRMRRSRQRRYSFRFPRIDCLHAIFDAGASCGDHPACKHEAGRIWHSRPPERHTAKGEMRESTYTYSPSTNTQLITN